MQKLKRSSSKVQTFTFLDLSLILSVFSVFPFYRESLNTYPTVDIVTNAHQKPSKAPR